MLTIYKGSIYMDNKIQTIITLSKKFLEIHVILKKQKHFKIGS